ncbi:MAG: GtrA family protein [Bacteroidales bacterium]|nr:GtrA family protein [Bacteroidales bacterium]
MREQSCTTLKRLVKHTCFSLFGTATDTFVLWVLSSFLIDGTYFTENILSPFISFECGNFVNFLVASHYVWGDRMATKTRSQFLKRFLAFNLSYFTVFFIKMGLLLAIQALTGWDVVICNLIALIFAGLINFFVNDKLIFRDKRGKGLLIKKTEFTKAMENKPGSGPLMGSEVFVDELREE